MKPLTTLLLLVSLVATAPAQFVVPTTSYTNFTDYKIRSVYASPIQVTNDACVWLSTFAPAYGVNRILP